MAISEDQKLKRLAQIPLFAPANKAQLVHIASIADEVEVKAGTVLAREGERGIEFFVIESGSARVDRSGTIVATLGAGDFFGEMSLIDGGPRTATVTATEPTTVLIVRKQAFDALQEDVKGLRAVINQALAQRIRANENIHTH
jgi:CRP/FNR family transcriptional regulator, cyclic AMP receptor protein